MIYSNEAVAAVSWSFTTLMILILLARLFTRFILVRNSGWEDYFVALSGCCCLIFSVSIVGQIANGLSQNNDDLTTYKRARFWQAFYGSTIAYNVSLTCTKISLLLQYLRIFPSTPWTIKFRRVCKAVLALVVGFGLWTCFGSIFQCWPISYMWDHSIDGHCYNETVVWFLNCGFNIATDIVIVILPLTQIRQLNLGRRDERLLYIVFGLAGLVVVASIMRQALVVMSKSFDIPHNNGSPAMWSSVEIDTGVICACLPPLRVLFTRIRQRFFPESAAKRKMYDNNKQFDFDLDPRTYGQDGKDATGRSSDNPSGNTSHTDIVYLGKSSLVHVKDYSSPNSTTTDLEAGLFVTPQWSNESSGSRLHTPMRLERDHGAPDVEFRRGSEAGWSVLDRRESST